MPALPSAPGTVKIAIKQTLANVTVNNVLHAYGSVAAGYTSSQLSALATAVRSAWVSNVIPLQCPVLTLTDVEVTDLSTNTGLSAVATGSTPGTATGTAAPANAAICWSWKIANRYRGGHPRTYIGGFSSTAMLNANTFTTTYVTANANAANAIQAAIQAVAVGSNFWALGCLSYYANKALRPVPEFRQFIGSSVDNRIDSQRRRVGRDR